MPCFIFKPEWRLFPSKAFIGRLYIMFFMKYVDVIAKKPKHTMINVCFEFLDSKSRVLVLYVRIKVANNKRQ